MTPIWTQKSVHSSRSTSTSWGCRLWKEKYGWTRWKWAESRSGSTHTMCKKSTNSWVSQGTTDISYRHTPNWPDPFLTSQSKQCPCNGRTENSKCLKPFKIRWLANWSCINLTLTNFLPLDRCVKVWSRSCPVSRQRNKGIDPQMTTPCCFLLSHLYPYRTELRCSWPRVPWSHESNWSLVTLPDLDQRTLHHWNRL